MIRAGHKRAVGVLVLTWALAAASAAAAWKDDVGFTELAAELGGALPTGAGIGVSQIEAGTGYSPGQGDAEFTGKTFTLRSGSTSGSGHATTVGKYYYGNYRSMTPGVAAIDCWSATNWMYGGFLHTSSTLEPEVETQRVQNHSWISSSTSSDLLRRLDYAIERDDFVCVGGVNNGYVPLPPVLSNSYNAISVGATSGWHSAGYTTVDVPGRIKPDIVAPGSATSWATPMVASAAALMLAAAETDPAWADAEHSETVKAILLAGATKEEFADWDRTATRPLDNRYGAGELNVLHSYHILAGGPQGPGQVDARAGWNFTQTPEPGQANVYFFDVAATAPLRDVSVMLTWNRQITDGLSDPGQWGSPQAFVADLNLRLYAADGSTLTTLLDESVSTVNNVEHLYETLLPGRYAVQVGSDTGQIDYALAWRGTEALAGDADLDGLVDLQDFGLLKGHFGLTVGATWADGDFNGDGWVDSQDFGLLKLHYGPGEALAVPGPGTVGTLCVMAGGLIRRRKSR